MTIEDLMRTLQGSMGGPSVEEMVSNAKARMSQSPKWWETHPTPIQDALMEAGHTGRPPGSAMSSIDPNDPYIRSLTGAPAEEPATSVAIKRMLPRRQYLAGPRAGQPYGPTPAAAAEVGSGTPPGWNNLKAMIEDPDILAARARDAARSIPSIPEAPNMLPEGKGLLQALTDPAFLASNPRIASLLGGASKYAPMVGKGLAGLSVGLQALDSGTWLNRIASGSGSPEDTARLERAQTPNSFSGMVADRFGKEDFSGHPFGSSFDMLFGTAGDAFQNAGDKIAQDFAPGGLGDSDYNSILATREREDPFGGRGLAMLHAKSPAALAVEKAKPPTTAPGPTLGDSSPVSLTPTGATTPAPPNPQLRALQNLRKQGSSMDEIGRQAYAMTGGGPKYDATSPQAIEANRMIEHALGVRHGDATNSGVMFGEGASPFSRALKSMAP